MKQGNPKGTGLTQGYRTKTSDPQQNRTGQRHQREYMNKHRLKQRKGKNVGQRQREGRKSKNMTPEDRISK